jgi:hypothetical protein
MTAAYENAVYSVLERLGATKNYLRQSRALGRWHGLTQEC